MSRPTLHRSNRRGGRDRCQPGSVAGARRRRPRVPQQQAGKRTTGDRRPRRGGATAPRRTASGQRAQHEERPVVHRLRDVLPWTRRVRSRPCSRGSLRALPVGHVLALGARQVGRARRALANNEALPEHRCPSGHVLCSRSGAREPWPVVAGSAQSAGPGGLWSSLPGRAARLSWRGFPRSGRQRS